MTRIEPAAASLAEQLMVISVNCQDVFIHGFMNWPRGKTLPKRESELLLIQTLAFAFFGSYMHLCKTRESYVSAATVEGMVDMFIEHGFDLQIKTTYEKYLDDFGRKVIDNAKVESVLRALDAIVRINKRCYQMHRETIIVFLEGFWDRISNLVEEFFQEEYNGQ